MTASETFAIGLDFGTESVRALVVDIATGRVAGQSVRGYAHGVIETSLPADGGGAAAGGRLPVDYALQHPLDWLDDAAAACRDAMARAAVPPENVIGVGVDFTSCTMLPALGDGTPLCLLEPFKATPLAWPKLWKHHGGAAEAERINDVARQRNEPWLARYGGTISLEWFFPKVLETLNGAPHVYDAAQVWLEAGDWFVWQLVDGPFPHCSPTNLVRSTCQAGYKAMWNADTGFPSRDYLAAVHPKLADVVEMKMPGVLRAPGAKAGGLSQRSAELFGLRAGTPVSAAIIDAHSGVPGAGVAEAGVMVMVLGTSSCHMVNSTTEALAPGIAGVVRDGILPGFFGYETGQASVGDAFAWLVKTLGATHEEMNRRAAELPPGSGGVLAVDWLNGCRTPLMDPRLSGGFVGLTLGTRPEQLYRAMMEATAFGVRWIADTLRGAGVPVTRFVASGGLPAKSPLLMQIYADVLGAPIAVAASDQPVALGAAILGCVAAGEQASGYRDIAAAVAAMAGNTSSSAVTYRPDSSARQTYDTIYGLYRQLTAREGVVADAMRQLRQLGDAPRP